MLLLKGISIVGRPKINKFVYTWKGMKNPIVNNLHIYLICCSFLCILVLKKAFKLGIIQITFYVFNGYYVTSLVKNTLERMQVNETFDCVRHQVQSLASLSKQPPNSQTTNGRTSCCALGRFDWRNWETELKCTKTVNINACIFQKTSYSCHYSHETIALSFTKVPKESCR